MTNLTLAPVNDALCKACTTEGWFMNTDQNRVMGFGEGAEGVVKFMVEYFEVALERDREDENFQLVGVYEAKKPIGFFGLEYLGPNRRTIHLFQFMTPSANGSRDEALDIQVRTLFSTRGRSDLSRIESDVLSINDGQIKVFKEAGFAQEGRKREAFWMGGAPFDVLNFGMTRKKHRKLKKKRGE